MKTQNIVSMLVLCACIAQAQNKLNALTDSEQKEGWKLLFDGKSTAGWRNYRKASISDKWKVQDNALVLTSKGGGDIISVDQFENFELLLEWKIQDCGNSGLFYSVIEDSSDCCAFLSGPEMQILDDKCHPDNKLPSHRAGCLYDMKVVSESTVKPAGEWNAVRLIKKNGKVEHWLNGKLVVTYEIGSEEWSSMLGKSKFKDWGHFAKYSKGHLALQDHGDVVSFRNIKIRNL